MKRSLIFCLGAALMAVSGVATAQTQQETQEAQKPLSPERFDWVWRSNPWNGGAHAAGLRLGNTSRSYAELFATKENGGLCDWSASDNSWTFGARTESIRHFKKVSFAGGFSYSYFDGQNMCGSMFMEPGYFPVDLLEFTPERKVREDYAFNGALSADLSDHLRGGLGIAFESGNYAKRKDLRHKNKRLLFECTPGLLYHRDRWAAGVSAIVGKRSERVEAKEVGISAETYEAFFDKGLAYGTQERWDGNGTHLNETGITGFPIKEMIGGVSVAASWGPLYVEVTWRDRNGKSGEKETILHEFEAQQWSTRGVVTFDRPRAQHFVRIESDWTKQLNHENILRRETINGVQTVLHLGSNPIFERKHFTIHGEYELHTRATTLQAGVRYEELGRRSTLRFPSVREQSLHAVTLYADWRMRIKAWEVQAAADLRTGGFSESAFDEATALIPGDYPRQLTDYYNYTNEYLTAPRLGLGVGVRRNIRAFYIDLSARYEHGFDLEFIPQANRVQATLTVGYNF